MFDHVGVAVSDLAASERFYRTVLSVLGVEPSHADAELVEWDDWAIGPTDREHPVTRRLHVAFRARDREEVDAFWQAGIDAGVPSRAFRPASHEVRTPRHLFPLLRDSKQRDVHQKLERFACQEGAAYAPAPKRHEPDPTRQRCAPLNGSCAGHGAPCRETPNSRASCSPG